MHEGLEIELFMKTFEQFLKENMGLASLGTDVHGGNPSEHTLVHAFRIAWRKHKEETQRFLNRLGERDPEIKRAMSANIPDDTPPVSKIHHDDMDEVMPPTSDGNSDSDQGDTGAGG